MIASVPQADPPNLGPRIVRLFRPHRGVLALIVAMILLTSVLSVISALLVRRVFDDALFVRGGPDLGALYPLVAALIAIPIVNGVLNVAQTYLTEVVGNRVLQELRNRLFEHLERLSLAFYTATRSGEVQSRLANDVGGVQTTITSTASSVVSNVVTLVSSVVAMLLLSPLLTAISLVATPVFVLFSRRVGRARRKARRDAQASLAAMGSITQETLSVSGILLAKVFGRQEHEVDRYRAENANQADLQIRQAIVGRSFFAVTQAFFGISPALVYLVAGLQGTNGDLSAGTLVAFTTLQTRLLFPINQLLQVSVDVQSSLALFGRIFELHRPSPPNHRPTRRAQHRRGRHPRRGRARARVVSIRRRRRRRATRTRGGAARRLDAGLARAACGAGRALRGGQDDDLVFDSEALRRRARGGHDRRSRRARPHRRDDRARGGGGHARELSVRRHGAREHQLRAADRHRR